MCLEQAHGGALFGARDCRREAGKAAADDRDLAHAGTVRANWLWVKVQLWTPIESQLQVRSCC